MNKTIFIAHTHMMLNMEKVNIKEALKFKQSTIQIRNTITPTKSKEVISQLTYSLEIQDSHNAYIHIDGFDTLSDEHKNQGFGTRLLRETAKQILSITRKGHLSIQQVYGQVVASDRPYWQYSIPMYYKFSKQIFRKNTICKLNNVVVEPDLLHNLIANQPLEKEYIVFKFYSFFA